MSLKIVVIIFVLLIAVAVGKFYERCELATEMRDKHNVWQLGMRSPLCKQFHNIHEFRK